jgi:DNA modification methylase
MELNKVYNEDCLEILKKLPDNTINTSVVDFTKSFSAETLTKAE